ncbi:TetR/AcrR family transcriptional regulator [Pseudomonas sp. ML96]|uniref:TetR/AcrR family transcriptional regulator n=1 Tax=Pseudomonas sp. ML96 TaxID=1523503 RepID=UPI00068DF44C|nr:TetR/AcrR family transcriptional regulator [Pseudomonas sp. ML96]
MSSARNYHHGNLRQSLIDAALQVIEVGGYQALSLRDLAQAVGVSSAAPYRHFPDRDALLRACACEGFRRLLDAQQKVVEQFVTAESRALAMCQGFLAFAEDFPGLFILMYDAGLIQQAGDEDELGQLLHRVYDGVAQTQRLGQEKGESALLQARVIAMWSTLYGYARLRQGNMLKSYMLGSASREQIERAVIVAATGVYPPEID